jgi:hypothetical protein
MNHPSRCCAQQQLSLLVIMSALLMSGLSLLLVVVPRTCSVPLIRFPLTHVWRSNLSSVTLVQ